MGGIFIHCWNFEENFAEKFLFFFMQKLDVSQGDWLRNSGWDPEKENIILIHGYAGGDDTLPMSVLRDGKLRRASLPHCKTADVE